MLAYCIFMIVFGLLLVAASYIIRRKKKVLPYVVRVTEDIPEMHVIKGQTGTVISMNGGRYLVEIAANDHDFIYALVAPDKLSKVV